MSQWLTYWAVWSTLTAAESLLPRRYMVLLNKQSLQLCRIECADHNGACCSRIPCYHHFKLVFLLWLQSSHYQVLLGSTCASTACLLLGMSFVMPSALSKPGEYLIQLIPGREQGACMWSLHSLGSCGMNSSWTTLWTAYAALW